MYGMDLSPSVEEMLADLEGELNAGSNAQQFLERIKTDSASNSFLNNFESSELSQSYSFPLSQAQSTRATKGLEKLSVEELLRTLERLSSEHDSFGKSLQHEGTERTLFCAVNLELNERGIIAPQFRTFRRLGRNKGHSKEESALSNDRQVIDLHWLYCSGKRNSIGHDEFGEIFTQDQFDFQMAATLACKPWTPNHKALNVLNLVNYEMLQLSWLRSKSINDTWRNTIKRMDGTIDRTLRAHTVREPTFAKYIDGLKKVWLVTHLVGTHGPVATARFYGWMTGQALAKSTWSEKVKTMKKRTGMNL